MVVAVKNEGQPVPGGGGLATRGAEAGEAGVHEPLVPPTAEMLRWADRLRPLLFPSQGLRGPARGLRTAMTTPLAHVTTFSFEFQIYLYSVFHRTWMARAGHAITMPLIVAATLGVFFTLSVAIGWLATGALAVYYVVLGARHAMTAVGLLSGAAAVGLGIAASTWVGSEWGVGWTSPWLVMLGLSLAQALTHSLEDVPPRVNGSRDWMPVREFFTGRPGERPPLPVLIKRLVVSGAMALAGALNEWWGSWRLLPILLLHPLWAAGYQPEARARHGRLLNQALVDRNPAVDFIGTGGVRGGPLAEPDHEWSS